MIRVATYNIRKCVGLDWRRQPQRIMRVLGEMEADVVALQEADRRLSRRSTLPLDRLTRQTGFRPVRIAAAGAGLGWHGNAILIRDGITVRDVAPLDLPSFESRGALLADLEIRGVPLRVVGVHFGLRPSDRRRQAQALLDMLDARGRGMPTVILGDLNEWSRDNGCLAVLAHRFRPAPPILSFHTTAPVAALDRILAGPGLHLTAAGAHRTPTALFASDHLPVWAALTVVPTGAGTARRPETTEAR